MRPKKEGDSIITIKIRAKTLERWIYSTIILTLLLLLIFNPWKECSCEEKTIIKQTELPVVETNLNNSTDLTAISSSEETNTTTNSELVEDSIGEQSEPIEKSSEEINEIVEDLTFSGKVNLKIDDIVVEDKGTYKKITGVEFTIKNDCAERFYPRAEIYVYQESTKTYDTKNIRGTLKYDMGITSGTEVELSVDLEKPATSADDNPITILVYLFDSKTDDFLGEIEKEFDI